MINIKKDKVGIPNRKRSLAKEIANQKYLMILLLPSLIYYIIFRYVPMYGLIIAFKDYDFMSGIMGSPWVGLKYFKEFLQGPYFGRLIRNTLKISITNLIFSFPLPIIFALLLNELKNQRLKKLTQTVSYLPHFLSVVVVVGLLKQLLSPTSGVVNKVISTVTGGDTINFFMEQNWFLPMYVSSGIWQELGYSAIIYISAIAGIDPALYEAATVDGAGRWRRIWNITLPSILPTISILLILKLGSLLEVGYEKVLLMYNPSIYKVSDVISTYVYRAGVQNANYSFGTAVGLLNSIVAVILIVISNKVSDKLSGNGLW
ncbi:MAG: sugar ABC transporter permease [Clostridia bacterium]|nr:sugar ABC transporter permease [Clostridia bacterium]